MINLLIFIGLLALALFVAWLLRDPKEPPRTMRIEGVPSYPMLRATVDELRQKVNELESENERLRLSKHGLEEDMAKQKKEYGIKVNLHALASELAHDAKTKPDNQDVVDAEVIVAALGRKLRRVSPSEGIAIIAAIYERAGA